MSEQTISRRQFLRVSALAAAGATLAACAKSPPPEATATPQPAAPTAAPAEEKAEEPAVVQTADAGDRDAKAERIAAARMKGYEGESCGECGNFTMVRNGTCLKCDTCGSTSGCS